MNRGQIIAKLDGEDFDFLIASNRTEELLRELGFGGTEEYEKDLNDPKWLEMDGT